MGIFDKVKNMVKPQEQEIILSAEQKSEPIKNYTEEEIIENINNSYAKALGLVNKDAISILENCKENAGCFAEKSEIFICKKAFFFHEWIASA